MAPADPPLACVVCGGVLDRDRPAADPWRIRFCSGCGLGHLSPWPNPDSARQLYTADYFSRGPGSAAPGYADYAGMEREHLRAARLLLRQVGRFRQPPGALFDVGCGFGYFLEAARDRGWTAAGSDISPAAAQSAKQRVGSVVCQPMQEISGQYDAVTAWDVLEHVQDPLQAVGAVRDALCPGGIFAFTTPDTASWDAHLLGDRWYGYTKAPEHVLYFNKRSVRALMRAAGLELLLCRGWGFVRSGRFVAEGLSRIVLGRAPPQVARLLPRWLGEASFFIPAVDLLAIARRPVEDGS